MENDCALELGSQYVKYLLLKMFCKIKDLSTVVCAYILSYLGG
jgi:hypothetical protein